MFTLRSKILLMETSSKQICEDLLALIKHVKTALAVIAEQHGLTHMQLYVLDSIRHGDVVTMGSVASNLHCDASNITGIIDRLVAQGLVTRRESQLDRRAKLLQLTAKGHKIIERITAKLPAQLGCDKLSAVERQDLHALIMRLV